MLFRSGTAKKIADGAPDYYKGVRGYMTVMRSVLYNKFVSGAPVTEIFATVIGTMPTTNTWSYATPIEVVNPTATTGETVDISNFYVDEGSGTYAAYPSIIVNTSSNPLIIKAGTAGRNTFNGVIISKGPIERKAGITINGTVIAGGPETMPDPKTGDRKAIFAGDHAGIIVEEGKVNITSDSGAILKVVAKDQDSD